MLLKLHKKNKNRKKLLTNVEVCGKILKLSLQKGVEKQEIKNLKKLKKVLDKLKKMWYNKWAVTKTDRLYIEK